MGHRLSPVKLLHPFEFSLKTGLKFSLWVTAATLASLLFKKITDHPDQVIQAPVAWIILGHTVVVLSLIPSVLAFLTLSLFRKKSRGFYGVTSLIIGILFAIIVLWAIKPPELHHSGLWQHIGGLFWNNYYFPFIPAFLSLAYFIWCSFRMLKEVKGVRKA